LILAALESQVSKRNASKVNARVVAEAANGPVTLGAAEILSKKIGVIDWLAWLIYHKHSKGVLIRDKRLEVQAGQGDELITSWSMTSHL